MIRVTIEAEPFGFKSCKTTLAEIKIINNGCGNDVDGNYDIEAFFPETKDVIKSATIHRREHGFFELVKSAIRQTDMQMKLRR